MTAPLFSLSDAMQRVHQALGVVTDRIRWRDAGGADEFIQTALSILDATEQHSDAGREQLEHLRRAVADVEHSLSPGFEDWERATAECATAAAAAVEEKAA